MLTPGILMHIQTTRHAGLILICRSAGMLLQVGPDKGRFNMAGILDLGLQICFGLSQ